MEEQPRRLSRLCWTVLTLVGGDRAFCHSLRRELGASMAVVNVARVGAGLAHDSLVNSRGAGAQAVRERSSQEDEAFRAQRVLRGLGAAGEGGAREEGDSPGGPEAEVGPAFTPLTFSNLLGEDASARVLSEAI